MKKKLIIVITLLILLTGCGKEERKIEDISLDKVISCTDKDILLNNNAILIDVRTKDEYNSGHLDKAINISSEEIAKGILEQVPDRDTLIIVYCQSGKRSAASKEILNNLGYEKVYDLGSINNCSK